MARSGAGISRWLVLGALVLGIAGRAVAADPIVIGFSDSPPISSRDATTFAASAEVHDEEGTLVATGTATYRYQPGSEDPEGTPLAKAGEKRSTSLG